MIRTALFDLDGTLLDTAPDLAWVLNRVREEQGLDPLPFETIRPAVSHGTTGLLRTGFGLRAGDPQFDALRQRLLALYQTHLLRETQPFPGMVPLLQALEERGVGWGVVTNKPGWLTEPLLQGLGLAPRAVCIVSGDTTPQRKPDPQPLIHACQLAGCEPPQCVYVGDAERDIQAGRNAGMHTLVAAFGYLSPDDRPEDWGADGTVDDPPAILSWVDRQNAQGPIGT